MLQFVNTVHRKIKEESLVSAEKSLLASVSGGQDSMCLLTTLYIYKVQIQFELDLIWLNHFWQRSSFFTMIHISKLSYSLSLRALLSIPLIQLLSEESARDWRHSATQRAHLFYQYDLCAQGHSKSDRVETVLFNLIRGAGLPGVSALSWTKDQACFSRNSLYPLFSQLLKQTHARRVGVAVPYFNRETIKICSTLNDVCVCFASSRKSLCCTVDLNRIIARNRPLNSNNLSASQRIEIAHFRRRQSRAKSVQATPSFSRRKISASVFEHVAIQAFKQRGKILVYHASLGSEATRATHAVSSTGNLSLLDARDCKLIEKWKSYYYQVKHITVQTTNLNQIDTLED